MQISEGINDLLYSFSQQLLLRDQGDAGVMLVVITVLMISGGGAAADNGVGGGDGGGGVGEW